MLLENINKQTGVVHSHRDKVIQLSLGAFGIQPVKDLPVFDKTQELLVRIQPIHHRVAVGISAQQVEMK